MEPAQKTVTRGTRSRKEQRNGKGDVWRVWWECDLCGGQIAHLDKYCRHCGVMFDG